LSGRHYDRHGSDLQHRSSGAELRILCLGASITFGVGSTTGNGYRKDLRDMLIAAGNKVTFVGTQSSGNMLNNANEGYPGMRIDQVMGFAWNSYAYFPNVVLVHLGTNDFVQHYDPQTSADRMGTLIDQIFSATPSTLVVISKLLPNNKTVIESGIQSFNSLLDGVVSGRTSKGKNVMLVDMHSSDFSIADLGPDGTHPTDAGYRKMAKAWFDTLDPAVKAGKVPAVDSRAIAFPPKNNNVCPVSLTGMGLPRVSQYGFGNKTATFKGVWKNAGTFLNHTVYKPRRWFWVDLTGSNGDDYVYVDDYDLDKDNTITAALNLGGEQFTSLLTFHNTPGCVYDNIEFADMDGDGIADFICKGDDRTLQVYRTLPGDGQPTWASPIQHRPDFGLDGSAIAIVDMNGDGLADVVSVTWAGRVSISYNLGNTWSNAHVIFQIPAFANTIHGDGPNFATIEFLDINGDG
jgi:lysophospholipase L1-like esterase